MKKVSNMGIHTSPDSHQGTKAAEKFHKKAMSVRASNPDMADVQLDMKKEREKLNRVLHIKERSLLLGQERLDLLNKQIIDKDKKKKKFLDAQRKLQKDKQKTKFAEKNEKLTEKQRRRHIDQQDFMNEWSKSYKEQLKEIEATQKEKQDKEKELALNDYRRTQQMRNNYMADNKSLNSAASPTVRGLEQYDYLEVEEQLQKYESKLKKGNDRNSNYLQQMKSKAQQEIDKVQTNLHQIKDYKDQQEKEELYKFVDNVLSRTQKINKFNKD